MSRRPLVLTALAVWAAGCGGPDHKTAPVSGRVTLDGKGMADATVQFYPDAPPGATAGPTSVGHTDSDGRFTLALVDPPTKQGAVVGRHKVFITLTPKQDPNDKRPKHYVQLPARYNRKTELTFDVPAAGTSSADFKLTSK